MCKYMYLHIHMCVKVLYNIALTAIHNLVDKKQLLLPVHMLFNMHCQIDFWYIRSRSF